MKSQAKISNIKMLHFDERDNKYKIAAEILDFQQPTTFSFPTTSVNRYDVVYGDNAKKQPTTEATTRITNTQRLLNERHAQLTPISWFLTRDVVLGACVVAAVVACSTTSGHQWVLWLLPIPIGQLLAILDFQRGDRERHAANVADFKARSNNCGYGYND